MTAERLSALDASFLAVESPTAPMHVGWVSTFDAARGRAAPGFAELLRAPRRPARAGPALPPEARAGAARVHEPVWVDDPDFDPAEHLLHAPGDDLDAIVDAIFSTPLPRDRPLWQIWIADGLPDGRVALIGKAHHCMVDGIAVVELGNLLLDAEPRCRGGPTAAAWAPAPAPSAGERLARARRRPRRRRRLARARAGAARAAAAARLPGVAGRGARTLAHTLLPPAPGSPLNRPGSPRRRHVRVHALARRRCARCGARFGVTPNDVVLAACAGALRRFAERRGEPPQR